MAFVVALGSAAVLNRPSLKLSSPFPSGTLLAGHAPPSPPSANKVTLTDSLERMPLYFIENRGQLDSRVAYYVQGRDTTLYFTADGMTLAQTDRREENGAKARLEKASLGRDGIQRLDPVSRWV